MNNSKLFSNLVVFKATKGKKIDFLFPAIHQLLSIKNGHRILNIFVKINILEYFHLEIT